MLLLRKGRPCITSSERWVGTYGVSILGLVMCRTGKGWVGGKKNAFLDDVIYERSLKQNCKPGTANADPQRTRRTSNFMVETLKLIEL